MMLPRHRLTDHQPTICVRLNQHQRDLIDGAAESLGKRPAKFVAETACLEAEHILLDRTHFSLDPTAFERFSAFVDNPPPPTEGLRRLLKHRPPWE